MLLSRFKYHMFYVLYQFMAYLQTLPHISDTVCLPRDSAEAVTQERKFKIG
jgi:hypothetical protein